MGGPENVTPIQATPPPPSSSCHYIHLLYLQMSLRVKPVAQGGFITDGTRCVMEACKGFSSVMSSKCLLNTSFTVYTQTPQDSELTARNLFSVL